MKLCWGRTCGPDCARPVIWLNMAVVSSAPGATCWIGAPRGPVTGRSMDERSTGWCTYRAEPRTIQSASTPGSLARSLSTICRTPRLRRVPPRAWSSKRLLPQSLSVPLRLKRPSRVELVRAPAAAAPACPQDRHRDAFHLRTPPCSSNRPLWRQQRLRVASQQLNQMLRVPELRLVTVLSDSPALIRFGWMRTA